MSTQVHGRSDMLDDQQAAVRDDVRAATLSQTPLKLVSHFHHKFGLPSLDQEAPRELTDEEALFRINFMLEELKEYAECTGFSEISDVLSCLCSDIKEKASGVIDRAGRRDFHGQLDALVDLSYVLHGTALFHGFRRFDEAFATVHAANMAKERAERAEQSKRGSTFDVIKPIGWKAPVLTEYLK